MLGVILGLSSACGFGLSPILVRLGLQHMRATTAALVSLGVGTGLTMVLAFSLNSGEIFDLSGVAFLWLLLSGTVTFAIARFLNFIGMDLAGVSRATPIIGSSPLFATILAVTIMGETVSLLVLAGTFCIVGGLALILSQR